MCGEFTYPKMATNGIILILGARGSVPETLLAPSFALVKNGHLVCFLERSVARIRTKPEHPRFWGTKDTRTLGLVVKGEMERRTNI